ncbi:MAG: hypothetical protein HWQ38_09670 [Nostoc sp. NMS7]|uniref:hypothetical protein n=1 Tax=Nostoc sp. NMS7 TaxID=2815391 RepID=UPI0025FDA5DE|nr:hypothetical protein [Nostoc sp. NMS7]MBN3946738.1 hypothetical protein [Nostoc sp. NMS7]
MSFIYTALFVPTIAALKALNATSDPKRVDGVFLAVGDRGDATPAWYRYVAAATDTESLPNIVSPTDTTGRWFQFSRDSSGGLSVANIATLKALNSTSTPKRVDGGFLAVGDRGDGIPAWYRYVAAATTTENLPSIVSPTDTVGRWIQFSGGADSGASNLVMTSSGNPPTTNPPTQSPTSGVMYIHLQIQTGYGSTTFSYWIGIDSTGTLGNNGWVFVKND